VTTIANPPRMNQKACLQLPFTHALHCILEVSFLFSIRGQFLQHVKSAKDSQVISVFLALLGFSNAKADCKTLVKSAPRPKEAKILQIAK